MTEWQSCFYEYEGLTPELGTGNNFFDLASQTDIIDEHPIKIVFISHFSLEVFFISFGIQRTKLTTVSFTYQPSKQYMWSALATSAGFLHILCLLYKDSRTLDSIYSCIHRTRQEGAALEEFTADWQTFKFVLK